MSDKLRIYKESATFKEAVNRARGLIDAPGTNDEYERAIAELLIDTFGVEHGQDSKWEILSLIQGEIEAEELIQSSPNQSSSLESMITTKELSDHLQSSLQAGEWNLEKGNFREAYGWECRMALLAELAHDNRFGALELYIDDTRREFRDRRERAERIKEKISQ